MTVRRMSGAALRARPAVREGEEDVVAGGDVGDGGADGEDDAGAFVAEDGVRAGGEDAGRAGEVGVAEAGGVDLDEGFRGEGGGEEDGC